MPEGLRPQSVPPPAPIPPRKCPRWLSTGDRCLNTSGPHGHIDCRFERRTVPHCNRAKFNVADDPDMLTICCLPACHAGAHVAFLPTAVRVEWYDLPTIQFPAPTPEPASDDATPKDPEP